MPIYAYRCASCGHDKDVLQKLSDAPLTVCPACGAATFTKQLTAAGFQLKGSGWYATDFKGGNTAKKADGDGKTDSGSTDAAKPEPGKTDSSKTESSKTESSKTESSKTEASKTESGKTSGAKPSDGGTSAKSGDGGSSSAAPSAPKTAGGGRSDAGH
jgi:putative FmdB family regulatory protein